MPAQPASAETCNTYLHFVAINGKAIGTMGME
jgi:hypothetical protein